MKKVFIVLLAIISMSVSAQKKEKIKGNREVLIKRFTVPTFSELEVGEKFEIEIQKSTDTTRIIIETDDNLFDVIHFSVEDNVLKFSTSKEIVKKKRLKITVFVPENFSRVKLIEKGKVFNEEPITFDNFVIDASGKGKADLNINIKNNLVINGIDKSHIKLKTSAGGIKLKLIDSAELEGEIQAKNIDILLQDHADCSLNGSVKQAKIEAQKKSGLKAQKLAVQDMVLKAMDGVEIKIQATGNLVLNLKGESETYLYGSPKINLKRFSDHAKLYKK